MSTGRGTIECKPCNDGCDELVRMAALGKLSARIAHELNNSLDGILRYLNLAIRVAELDGPDNLVRYLHRGRDGMDHLADIVRELLDYSRSHHSVPTLASLGGLMDQAVEMMSNHASMVGVDIELDIAEVAEDEVAGNLYQVFCNLIKNAIDAMDTGGRLRIIGHHDDQGIRLTFSDTGPGIVGQPDRLFEPFYTTKGQGKGTGLGLAICRELVGKLGGAMTAENLAEGGACFTVHLPQDNANQEKEGRSV